MKRSLTSALLVAALASVVCAQTAPQYRVERLGPAGFLATGISGGNVAGTGDEGSFLVTAGGAQAISAPDGTGLLGLGGVSRNGAVAGTAGVPRGAPTAFVWQNGAARLLATDNGDPMNLLYASRAVDVNDAGTVIGNGESPLAHQQGGIVWSGDGYRLLTSLDPNDEYADTTARAINNTGVVAGSADVGGVARAVVWDADGNARLVDGLGGRTSIAADVNDLGVAVGYRLNADDTFSAYLNDGVATTFLPNLAGFLSADAAAINGAGTVVGYSLADPTQEGVATLWQNGTAYNLNSLLGPTGTGWNLLGATGIDEDGAIVGYGYHNGDFAAFRLTPVPEPATLAAFACGLAALARRRAKRPL